MRKLTYISGGYMGYGHNTTKKEAFTPEEIQRNKPEKVKYATYKHYPEGTQFAIRHHHTDIVVMGFNNVTLNSGGWHSVTTKERMCAYLPEFMWIRQHKFNWYIVINLKGNLSISLDYQDGITLDTDHKTYINKVKRGEYGNKLQLQLIYKLNES